MVVECSQCKGIARVDESILYSSARVKIRCPHCAGTGFVLFSPAMDHEIDEFRGDWQIGRSAESSVVADRFKAGKSPLDPSIKEVDPTLPADAFEDFRARSGKEMSTLETKYILSRSKLLLLAALSLAVVAFFALVVNLILPGPSGEGFMRGVSYQEPTRKP